MFPAGVYHGGRRAGWGASGARRTPDRTVRPPPPWCPLSPERRLQCPVGDESVPVGNRRTGITSPKVFPLFPSDRRTVPERHVRPYGVCPHYTPSRSVFPVKECWFSTTPLPLSGGEWGLRPLVSPVRPSAYAPSPTTRTRGIPRLVVFNKTPFAPNYCCGPLSVGFSLRPVTALLVLPTVPVCLRPSPNAFLSVSLWSTRPQTHADRSVSV